MLDPGGITTVQYFVREYVSFAPYMTVVDGPPVRSVDFFSEVAVLPATTYGLFTRSRYLPLSSGFFTMSGVPGGGISLAWTPKDLSGLAGNYDPVISGEYGYWRAGDYIFRIRFDADSPSELVVTTPNLIGWNVVGGAVVFTKFLSGTNVGTFRVSTPGAAPELVLSSDMAVRQIVEW